MNKAEEVKQAIEDYEKSGITVHGQRKLTMSGGGGLQITIPMSVIRTLSLKKGETVTVLSYNGYLIADLAPKADGKPTKEKESDQEPE